MQVTMQLTLYSLIRLAIDSSVKQGNAEAAFLDFFELFPIHFQGQNFALPRASDQFPEVLMAISSKAASGL